MFQENLKFYRKEKGLTQEALAARLHVVRQTVSKWEKGLSVPDAELLIKLAALFEVPVSALLGAAREGEGERGPEKDAVALQLAAINEQLAVKNRRARRVWRTVAAVLIGLAALNAVLLLLSIASFGDFQSGAQASVAQHSELTEQP